jgi:hypothetical protein
MIIFEAAPCERHSGHRGPPCVRLAGRRHRRPAWRPRHRWQSARLPRRYRRRPSRQPHGQRRPAGKRCARQFAHRRTGALARAGYLHQSLIFYNFPKDYHTSILTRKSNARSHRNPLGPVDRVAQHSCRRHLFCRRCQCTLCAEWIASSGGHMTCSGSVSLSGDDSTLPRRGARDAGSRADADPPARRARASGRQTRSGRLYAERPLSVLERLRSTRRNLSRDGNSRWWAAA